MKWYRILLGISKVGCWMLKVSLLLLFLLPLFVMQFSKRENYSETKQWKSPGTTLSSSSSRSERSSCLQWVCVLTWHWRLLPLSGRLLSCCCCSFSASCWLPLLVCGAEVEVEVEAGLSSPCWSCCEAVRRLQFQFKWKQTVGTLYLCILRRSFSLFASVMLRDFRVYLKIQMDGHGLYVLGDVCDAVPHTYTNRYIVTYACVYSSVRERLQICMSYGVIYWYARL